MRRFFHVCDRETAAMDNLLFAACEARQISYQAVWLPLFDYTDPPALEAGDLLYRSAVDAHAHSAEQVLWKPGVGSFYRCERRLFAPWSFPSLRLAREGLPVPHAIPYACAQRPVLRGYVGQLGGFPLIVKVSGGEGGVGVMQVDSLPGLHSLVDHLGGREAQLMELIPDAECWRVVVVGDRAVAGYRQVPRQDDFRSVLSDVAEDYFADVEAVAPELAALAVRAVHCLDLAFGGVDLLRSASRQVVLEVNFPCYWPIAQERTGVDVAGAMLDWLRAQADAPPAPEGRTRTR